MMQLALLDPGQTLLTNLLSSGEETQLDSFTIGATAGFTPDETGTIVTGSLLYNGAAGQIQYTKVSENEIVFIVYLDDTVGDFTFGNVIIYLKDPLGGPRVPFLWAVLNSTTNKNEDQFSNYIVGNRVMIHCTIWFPYITQALDLTQNQQLLVQMQNYADETVIPTVYEAQYDQIIIDEHTRYNATSMLVKDTLHGYWWGMAFSQNLNDPTLGSITGGIVTGVYGSPSDITYYDGQNYTQNNAQFQLIDGGNSWVNANTTPVDGGSYSDVFQ